MPIPRTARFRLTHAARFKGWPTDLSLMMLVNQRHRKQASATLVLQIQIDLDQAGGVNVGGGMYAYSKPMCLNARL